MYLVGQQSHEGALDLQLNFVVLMKTFTNRVWPQNRCSSSPHPLLGRVPNKCPNAGFCLSEKRKIWTDWCLVFYSKMEFYSRRHWDDCFGLDTIMRTSTKFYSAPTFDTNYISLKIKSHRFVEKWKRNGSPFFRTRQYMPDIHRYVQINQDCVFEKRNRRCNRLSSAILNFQQQW